ncbi:MAG TPA: hypothetical protein V6D03_15500, partial [Candidatus Caenarcaniphilales bacterium]
MKSPSAPRPSLLNRPVGWGLATFAAIALCVHQAGALHQDWLNLGGWNQLWSFVRASTQPDLSPELLHLTLDATLITLAYAVCGTVLSVMLGMGGGIL